MAVDVIFGEIVREYFETVAREMNTTMDNTSVSPVFSETHDCSAGLFYYDGQDVSIFRPDLYSYGSEFMVSKLQPTLFAAAAPRRGHRRR